VALISSGSLKFRYLQEAWDGHICGKQIDCRMARHGVWPPNDVGLKRRSKGIKARVVQLQQCIDGEATLTNRSHAVHCDIMGNFGANLEFSGADNLQQKVANLRVLDSTSQPIHRVAEFGRREPMDLDARSAQAAPSTTTIVADISF
jgi:hypothetical protein